MRVRCYGSVGPLIVVVHGGPGAPGTMAPVARELARWFRMVEPFQRASGGEPLTVARHLADLFELVRAQDRPPALVGSSWGGMLALAYAAAHPDASAPLVLVGCGTFDEASRALLQATIDARLAERHEHLKPWDQSLLPVYSYDVAGTGPAPEEYDARAYAGRAE
jgi:pimeloyl-ACP methyl ester carboxylesterase